MAGSHPTRALQRDCESVTINGLDEGMQLLAIHSIARSIAAHSSSNELVKAAPLARMDSNLGGSSWICTTAAAPPWSLPPTADPSVKMVRSEFHLAIAASAAVLMMTGSSALLAMPSRSGKMRVE